MAALCCAQKAGSVSLGLNPVILLYKLRIGSVGYILKNQNETGPYLVLAPTLTQKFEHSLEQPLSIDHLLGVSAVVTLATSLTSVWVYSTRRTWSKCSPVSKSVFHLSYERLILARRGQLMNYVNEVGTATVPKDLGSAILNGQWLLMPCQGPIQLVKRPILMRRCF